MLIMPSGNRNNIDISDIKIKMLAALVRGWVFFGFFR